MTTDAFPKATTLVRNWLNSGQGSRGELLRYLMGVYARPLGIYLLGSSYRNLGEPDDIVHGFFVAYLAREGYLEKWKDTGKRLRHWLANGLLFYCKDRINEQRRHRGEAIDDAEPVAPAPETLDRYEAEVKAHMVREALAQAGRQCAAKGLGEHWKLFELYHLRHVPLEQLAGQFEIKPDRAWVMVRTAQRAFAKFVREMVAADIDSVDPKDVDREIGSL